MKRKLSASELLELLNTQWCDSNMIMKIAHCGKNTALSITRKIREELDQEGLYLPHNQVPTEAVIKYFKINLNLLEKISKFNGSHGVGNIHTHDVDLKEREDKNEK